MKFERPINAIVAWLTSRLKTELVYNKKTLFALMRLVSRRTLGFITIFSTFRKIEANNWFANEFF